MKPYIKISIYLFYILLFLGIVSYPQISDQVIGKTATIRAQSLQPSIADKVLRFHVLANSNSPKDQAVKLRVRDAVGTYLEPLLENSRTKESCERIVSENLEQIVEIANETLLENGYDYGATAKISSTDFPEKNYGSYTFPPGTYDALNITLGEGGGHNWWCVLYPNMCFRGSVYEVVDTDSGKALRKVLSSEEYEAVIKSGNYKIRFKLLEYFQ